MQSLTIPARDGYPIAATLYPAGKRLYVISSANATPQRFYQPFAEYLQNKGASVLTYDYRGIAGSRQGSLRGFEATMTDWALNDMAGIYDWVESDFQPEQVIAIGHSFGGQTAGLLPNSHLIDVMVTMSAQSGYWGLQGGNEKWNVLLMMYTVFPLLPRLLGYLPWNSFAKAEDLPKGVALQWMRWCRDPKYLLSDDSLPLERYADFTAPTLAYSFTDDDWGTAKSVKSLMSAYPNVTFEDIDPANHGLKSIGHFGFFRPKSEVLWERMLAWIEKKLAADERG